MSTKNSYTVLGVKEHASAAAIKKAWLKLIKKWHPDRNPEEPLAHQRSAEANAAYDELSDPGRRRELDVALAKARRPPAPAPVWRAAKPVAPVPASAPVPFDINSIFPATQPSPAATSFTAIMMKDSAHLPAEQQIALGVTGILADILKIYIDSLRAR